MSHKRFQVILALAVLSLAVMSQAATGVLTGTIKKVDTGAKVIAVETADGTVKTLKYTSKTTVRGLKGAAKGADLAGREGDHAIVRTSGETVDAVDWVGNQTVHATEGTVEFAGQGTKIIALKTAEGAKETFRVADHATVDTGKQIARYSEVGAKKGEHVTVYYTKEGGKKVVHVFKRLL